MNRLRIRLFTIVSICSLCCIATAQTIEERIDLLLGQMTVDEKIGQMTLFTSDWDVTGPTLRATYKDDIRSGKVGAIFNAHTASYTRDLQRIAIEETRLGIPLLFGYDVIHGYRTIFPISLAEAASWDIVAIELSARIAATEAAAGLHWTFAPMVDIARDPRWGRISEGSGEEPYLGVQIAVARVRGFQGDDLSAVNTIAACTKHYAAYGAAQAGRDYHTVDISERVLREIYLPPFKATVDAGVRTFMTAFNEVDGIPATGSHHLLTDILRDEWGFDGFVVTDYTSINEMIPHGYARDEKHAGALALNAGVDMDMQGAVYYNHLTQSLSEGSISISQVDQAVRNVLRIKFELGLFEDPYRYSDEARQEREILSAAHIEAARDVARKSIVLLKNNQSILPLSKSLSRIAVVGPLADAKSDQIGSWHAAGQANECTSFLEGLKAAVRTHTHISFTKGCDVNGADKSMFPAAIQSARDADVILAVVGEHEWMSGEAASRSMIGLPGVQRDLIEALIETGKPVVVILMNGRPLAIPWITEHADAILETWFGGTQAGPAICDVLFGEYNPSGKLPVTFPRNEGQIPIFLAMKHTGRPMQADNKYTSKYLDVPNTPLYPFGFGLSYTSFSFTPATLNKSEFKYDEPIIVSATVQNSGDRAGHEVAQLYVRDLVGSVTRPVKELKGFQKIFLHAGESRQISFTLTSDDLRFYTADMTFCAEPGAFEFYIGGSSDVQIGVTGTLLK
jgi:beta-glucosidase